MADALHQAEEAIRFDELLNAAKAAAGNRGSAYERWLAVRGGYLSRADAIRTHNDLQAAEAAQSAAFSAIRDAWNLRPAQDADARDAAIKALLATWAARQNGQHAGYLSAPEVVDIVLSAMAQARKEGGNG